MAERESKKPLFEEPEYGDRFQSYRPRHRHCMPSSSSYFCPLIIFTLVNFLIFLSTVTILVLVRTRENTSLSPRELQKRVSVYYLSLPHPIRTDGSLLPTANSSILRAPPSPAVDAAWDSVAAAHNEVILVNASTLSRAGHNPALFFRAPASWGRLDASGQRQYPVQIDVFHQIHCLDAIRKAVHWNHYNGPGTDGEAKGEGKGEMHEMHMRHCMHIVLQSLMCNANVEIIPHRWVEREKLPFALFGVDRRCRNFEGLKKWNGANGLLDIREEWHRLEREEGEYVWSEYGSRTTTKRSGIRENFYGS